MPRKPRRYASKGKFKAAKGCCRFCRGQVPAGRLTFCSELCVKNYRAYRSGGGLRAALFERDNGVCKTCGLDCTAVWDELRRWKSSFPVIAERILRELRINERTKTLWDADHIVPVSEGGGACGLSNIATLCRWCHKNKSGDDSRRRAGKPARTVPVPTGAAVVNNILLSARLEVSDEERRRIK